MTCCLGLSYLEILAIPRHNHGRLSSLCLPSPRGSSDARRGNISPPTVRTCHPSVTTTGIMNRVTIFGRFCIAALALPSKSANPSQVSAADTSAPEFRSWHTNENQKLRYHCAPNDSATSRTLSYAPAESTGSSKVLRRCRRRTQIFIYGFIFISLNDSGMV